MGFLRNLETTSFKKIVKLSLIVFLVLAIPVLVGLSQIRTRTTSTAYFEKPQVVKPITPYGLPSPGDPTIKLVWPFLGKIGDATLIEGENFGDNPQDKKLTLGEVVVPEQDISRWTPKLIEFNLPAQSKSGNLKLEVAGKVASWPYFYTVYNTNTKTRITESNRIIQVLNAAVGAQLTVFFSDASQTTTSELNAVPLEKGKTVLSLSLTDKNNLPLEFFVEPEEFGF